MQAWRIPVAAEDHLQAPEAVRGRRHPTSQQLSAENVEETVVLIKGERWLQLFNVNHLDSSQKTAYLVL